VLSASCGGLSRSYPDRNPLELTLLSMYTRVALREGSTLQGVSAWPILRCFVACQLHIPCVVINICDLRSSGARYPTAVKVPWATTMSANRGDRRSSVSGRIRRPGSRHHFVLLQPREIGRYLVLLFHSDIGCYCNMLKHLTACWA
jgi:hypothetical protein